ncbi:MAG TPA: 2Fe-2S iron-sulfur cluster-binding protein [Ktedonobacterales bacterium]|nr:2Fe-2S iron-sulfur cluster-binding protein [Ktedonobacterales bacterium]
MREDSPTQGLPVISPAHMLPVQVIRREVVAPDVVSVSIVLPGTEQAPAPHLPGQFVTLALPTPRETLYRSYSLCGSGDVRQPWELTIKRMEMGAVSTYFYTSVRVGTLLYASLPRGTFTLPAPLGPAMTLVFVAVGSGITPLMGMMRAIDAMPPEERPLVQLHYASRSPDEVIFGEELDALDPDEDWLRQWHYLSSDGERLTPDTILSRAGSLGLRAQWYMCGPNALKDALHRELEIEGVPDEHVHSEVFATALRPAYRVEAGDEASVGGSVTVSETGATLDVQPQETLLSALERHGYKPRFSCRSGVCGECKLRVTDGQVDPVGEALSAADRREGYVLSCIAHPIGDITIASGGRPPVGVARVAAFAAARGAGQPPRASAVLLSRVATLVGTGALVVGFWTLTNHRPYSWNIAAAQVAQATATTAPTGPTATLAPGVTPSPTGASATGGAAPTATTGSGPTATPGGAPTATTQAQPTATPKPKPQPTATTKPS